MTQVNRYVHALQQTEFGKEQEKEAPAQLMDEIQWPKTEIVTKKDIMLFQSEFKRDMKEMDVKLEHIQGEFKRDMKEMNVKLEHIQGEFKRDMKEMNVKLEHIQGEFKRDMKEMDVKLEHIQSEFKRDMKEMNMQTERLKEEFNLKTEQLKTGLSLEIEKLKTYILIRFGVMIAIGITVLLGLMKADKYLTYWLVQKEEISIHGMSKDEVIPRGKLRGCNVDFLKISTELPIYQENDLLIEQMNLDLSVFNDVYETVVHVCGIWWFTTYESMDECIKAHMFMCKKPVM